jgi:hypothetical protein
VTLAINDGTAPKDVTGGAVRTSGGLKSTTEIWIRTAAGSAGALKQVYAALAIALSTYSAIGRGNSATVLPVTSEPVTATVTGAIGTVTHAWTRTAADSQPWTINSPTAATTTFTTSCDQGESFTATFIDTATDQAGQVIASTAVTVSCANIYYGGGYPGSGGTPGTPYP